MNPVRGDEDYRGSAGELVEIVAVIDVGNKEIVFSAVVGRCHLDRAQ